MNRKFSQNLKKICFLAGALILGSKGAVLHATGHIRYHRHHDGMHRHWGNRPGSSGSDSSWAHHRPGNGQGRFGQDHDGFDHRGGRGEYGRGKRGFGHGQHRFGPRYTPEQRQQVAAINKDYRQKSAELYKQDNLTLKQYKAGLIALQKDKKTKLDGLLTQQQKDDMATRRKRMSENRQVMEVARLERLKLHLNLSDDQVAKIKAGQDGLRSQFKAIHENDNLLPQQKMEQMKVLMAKRNDTYKAVLTPDQYTQFEQMSRHRGDRFGGGRMGHRPGSGDDGK